MLCCLKKNIEKKNLSKPLLSESKSSTGEPKTPAEPKPLPERKVTGFESLPVPEAEPKMESKMEPKMEPTIEPKVEVKQEPITYQEISIPKPEIPANIESDPEIIKPRPQRNEKKNRSKSNRN
jgi:hypothetical protein